MIMALLLPLRSLVKYQRRESALNFSRKQRYAIHNQTKLKEVVSKHEISQSPKMELVDISRNQPPLNASLVGDSIDDRMQRAAGSRQDTVHSGGIKACQVGNQRCEILHVVIWWWVVAEPC